MAFDISATEQAIDALSLQRRVKIIIDPALPGSEHWQSRAYDLLVLALDLLIVAITVLDTVKSISSQYRAVIDTSRLGILLILTLDYGLRLWTCTIDPRYQHPFWGRLRYATSFFAILDLIAIVPCAVALLAPVKELGRTLRLFPMVRLLQMVRYSEPLRTFGRVLRAKREELYVMLFIVFILLMSASSLMFVVEHDAQPKAFGNLLDAMWWGIVTLTSVGYGDVYPITPLGKILGGLISLMGIGIFALPAGILAAGFSEELRKRKTKSSCPHCGKDTGLTVTVFSKNR